MDSSSRSYKAILFDMGGVLFQFPKQHELHEFVARLRSEPDVYAAYSACELGQIPVEDIVDLLEPVFPGVSSIKDFEKADPKDYLGPVNYDVIQAAKKLRLLGFTIGVITNNYFWSSEGNRTTSIPEIYEISDAVIMLDKIDLKANECIFVDDFLSNVEAAAALGFTAIQKDVKDFENAELEDYSGSKNEDVLQVIRQLKKLGIKVGLLTNNFFWSNKRKRSAIISEAAEFDDVVESCRVGCRKPEREIFEIMADRLGVRLDECIFVDDWKKNVDGAEAAGLAVEHDEDYKNALHKYERGESSVEEFPQFAVRFKPIFDEKIAKAIKVLKNEGIKVVLLTNNGFLSAQRKRSLILSDLSAYDLVVESCRVGHRKPDAEIYELTTKQLGCKPEEIAFIDDLLINVEAAERHGWIGIHLANNDSEQAVRRLEELFDVKIL
ncbi:Bifunctional epoxide hydrolase 2 [Aphelenchoides besseyi]|nr:Bifunctional epoxide hydrolase 2 [Aphelenchoides besseyi]